MDEARGRDEWNRFSVLLATIINSNPFRSGTAIRAEDLNPYQSEGGGKSERATMVTIKGSEIAIRYGAR
jgi:hypothetical protein